MTIEQFNQQWEAFKYQSVADGRFTPSPGDWNQIFDDDRPSHDEKDFSFDYWVHCSWAARKVAEFAGRSRPSVSHMRTAFHHYDFGSYAYFAGIVSAFVPDLTFVDIRGLPGTFGNMHNLRGDLTAIPLPDGSVESVSSLHVLEHVGLGRYGDKIDASGDLKAAAELTRILAPGGQLIMVLPMNENPRVTFNSDRYFSLEMVRQMFSSLKLSESQFIAAGSLRDSIPTTRGEHYTGCFVFTK